MNRAKHTLSKLIFLTQFTVSVLLISGCGGGSESFPVGTVSGAVTDITGASVVGARVAVGGISTTTATNGSFRLDNIPDGFQLIGATKTVNGLIYSGENVVDVASGEKNRSLNIVVSDERFQGVIDGRVIDGANFPLIGAKVFINGPFGSILAVTDQDGRYTAPRIPPGRTYHVTASLAGYVNTSQDVTVANNQTVHITFRLILGLSQGKIPPPQNVSAQAWTVASVVNRSDDRTRAVYSALKQYFARKKGLRIGPQARNIQRRGPTRDTPAGSLIEIDLFWDPRTEEDLLGYVIERATGTGAFAEIALLRDPLAGAFFDLDHLLTPDIAYRYDVRSVDTVDFPANGTVGDASQVVSANPLRPLSTVAPHNGQVVSATPVFQWTAVNGAASYQIFLWDQFPALLNGNDPDGVSSIWQGGHSSVNAPNTSSTYDGPALQSGHTYYWLVVAQDSTGTAFSASELAKFVTP